RPVHHREADPTAVLGPDDRAAMREEGGEGARTHAAVGETVADRDRLRVQRAAGRAVTVAAALAAAFDRLGKFVDIVDAARGVHPPRVGVEALVDEELAPGGRAVRVEA